MSERKGRSSRGKEFTPLADAKQAILRFGASHPRLTYAGATVAVVAMGALLIWFQCYSSYNAPAQFVYAGF